jgi:hypothetical protein
MFERSASGDDLVPCPNCGVDSDLRVRFHTKSPSISHSQTEVFCPKCGKTFSADETRWAYADWNAWAIGCWQSKGKRIDIAPLYSLLKEEADFQRNQERLKRDIGERISASLAQFVDCPWKPGSRFRSNRWPTGIWEVTTIERIYATNTGPMWLIRARKVKSSGFLGENSHEFPGRDADQLEAIAPYWRPANWSQLVVGDDCLHNLIPGTIVAVDQARRRATIELEGETSIEINTLRSLQVPIPRFQSMQPNN